MANILPGERARVNKSGLKRIENWPELAKEARWSAASLAKNCRVSIRTLHRFFLKNMGVSTKAWLAEQRQHNAFHLLGSGSSIKEAAFFLGYKQSSNFTRKYKKHWGICPSRQPIFANGNEARAVRK